MTYIAWIEAGACWTFVVIVNVSVGTVHITRQFGTFSHCNRNNKQSKLFDARPHRRDARIVRPIAFE